MKVSYWGRGPVTPDAALPEQETDAEAPRYEVQVWIRSDASPVFEDDEVVSYSTDDPTWLSLTTIWEGEETVWMYPVSQIAEVRIRRRES